MMNWYADSFHAHGQRRETNNLVCVTLGSLVTPFTWQLPFHILLQLLWRHSTHGTHGESKRIRSFVLDSMCVCVGGAPQIC